MTATHSNSCFILTVPPYIAISIVPTADLQSLLGELLEIYQLEINGFCYHHRFQHHHLPPFISLVNILIFLNFCGPLHQEPIVASFSNLPLLIANAPFIVYPIPHSNVHIHADMVVNIGAGRINPGFHKNRANSTLKGAT
jgi:hypothetical protein